MLKVICYLISISLVAAGCNNASSTATGNGPDSTQRETAKDKDIYHEEQEIKNMIREMVNICEIAVTKDTVFIVGNDTLSVAFSHSCNGDSFLLPAKYIEPFKIDRFIAHSLKTNIVIEKNGVTILDKTIEKKDFGSFVDGDLKRYAVLLYPVLKQTGDSIYIDYSLSVPLTDVGIGVKVGIGKDGGMHFGLN